MSHRNNSTDAKESTYAPTVPSCSVGELPVMLKSSQAASIANCSVKHLTDLLNEHEIPGLKIGNAWRIPRDPFLRFLGLELEA